MVSWMAGLRLQKDPDVISRAHPKETLLYNIETNRKTVISDAAKEIWASIDGCLTQARLIEKITFRSGYGKEELEKAFNFLYNSGLIYVVSAQNAEILKVSQVPQKKSSVNWRREFYDMVYLLDTSCVKTNPFMLLNNLYGRVWGLIDGVRTVSDVINEIRCEFGDRANPNKVEAFILELKRLKLISLVGEEKKTEECMPVRGEPVALMAYPHFLQDAWRALRVQVFLRFTPVPWYVTWEVTYRCNLSCRFCYAAGYPLSTGVKRLEEFSPKEVQKIVIRQLIESGVYHVILTGGEPFVRQDIFDIVEALRRAGILVKIFTNGTFITKKVAKRLSEIGVNQVSVGLDGVTANLNDSVRGKGVFDKVVVAIQNLKDEDIPVAINFTVTRKNHRQVDEVPKLAAELGVDQVFFSKFFSQGRGLNYPEWELTSEQRKGLIKKFVDSASTDILVFTNWYCEAGQKKCCISPTGNVRPCIFHSKAVGNMREQHLLEIWRNSTEFDQLRRPYAYKDVCRSCKDRYMCIGTYCSAMVWRENKHILCSKCIKEYPLMPA